MNKLDKLVSTDLVSESLEKFENVIDTFNKTLDVKSSQIKKAEDLLRKSGLRSIIIMGISGHGNNDEVSLSWQADSNIKNKIVFRLMFISNYFDGEKNIHIEKPFIETAGNIRMKYSESLPRFMNLALNELEINK